MTREEFINWFEERFALTKNDIYELGQLYDEVTKPHWISVDEQDIPLGQWVITYAPNEINYCKIDVELLAMDETAEDFGITHWMPIPQAPKEGGEE